MGGSGSFGSFKGDMEAVLSSNNVNFLSYIQLTTTALKALLESQGGIVVMSSMSGNINGLIVQNSIFIVPYLYYLLKLSTLK